MLIMVINMDEARRQTMEQVKVFLERTLDIVLEIPKAHYYHLARLTTLISCSVSGLFGFEFH